MKKNYIHHGFMQYMAIICLYCGTIPMFSQQRTESQALEIAAKYLHGLGISNTGHLECASRKSNRLHKTGQYPFFIINDRDNSSFVIVSGDERMEKVLGFARNSTYSETSVPDGLKWLLNEYQAQYDYIRNLGNYADEATMPGQKYNEVEPLIKTNWAQGFPFNKYCPIINGSSTLTGCLATSMAQVMNYYQYPKCGKDSISFYTHTDSVNLKCNFTDSIYYDWTHMINDYGKRYTDLQANAVANLMYACGTSLGMDYGNLFSSAFYTDIPYALVHFFGYATCATYCNRNYYRQDEWMDMLHEELDNGRPILYSGQDEDDGGHSFIIDGVIYDTYFHINWGWGGYCDGYYMIDALQPEYEFDYKYDQTAIVRISPTMTGTTQYVFYANNFEPLGDRTVRFSSQNKVTLQLNNVYNYSQICTSVLNNKYFSGYFGLAIFRKGKLVKTFCKYNITSNNWMAMNWGYRQFQYVFGANEVTINRGDTCSIKPVIIKGNTVTPIRTYNYGETDSIIVTRPTTLELQFYTAKEFEQATAIPAITSSRQRYVQKGIYTIDGNKITFPQRGINIIDGRKVWNGIQ